MKVSEATGKISSVTNMIAGFLLFPGVEELDFAGPWGDVSHLSIYANGPYANGPAKCLTFSESGGEVGCAKGLRISADFELDFCLFCSPDRLRSCSPLMVEDIYHLLSVLDGGRLQPVVHSIIELLFSNLF